MNLKNILVVDDEKEIVNLVSIYLQNDGFTVFKAYDGEEALDLFAEKKIDLIILDIMMPKMDGMEVCRRLRETNTVPILMLSAKAEDMDKVLGLMTGADDYMIKPFNPLELIARVKSLLRRSYQFKQMDQEVQTDILTVNSLEINFAALAHAFA
ncbi:MAG: response regulator transcription factor, partial [Heyndrickxia sp.]